MGRARVPPYPKLYGDQCACKHIEMYTENIFQIMTCTGLLLYRCECSPQTKMELQIGNRSSPKKTAIEKGATWDCASLSARAGVRARSGRRLAASFSQKMKNIHVAVALGDVHRSHAIVGCLVLVSIGLEQQPHDFQMAIL